MSRPIPQPPRLRSRGEDHHAELLDQEAAAARLGISTRMLRRLYTERRIAFVKVGRHVRFRPQDLDAFVDANRVASAR